MKRFLFTLTIAISVVSILACMPSEDHKVEPEKTVPVRIEIIKQQDLPIVVEAIGRLEPNRDVTLSAEVSAVVKAYHVDVGDKIDARQLLVELNPLDFQLGLNEARANLSAARARLDTASKSFDRSKKLLPRKVIAPDAFEKSEAEFRAARAAVNQANALVNITMERLKKTEIKSPFAGMVAKRMVELGQAVGPGQAIMNIVDLDVMRVRVHLSEHDYVHLDQDDPVSVTIEAMPDKTYKGRIDRIGIKADPMTNTFDVEILVENQGFILKAGLAARVNLTSHFIRDAIMIPQSSVLYRERAKEVFIVGADQTAMKREIKIGQVKGSLIQVLEGLQSGDRLVVTGGEYLKPGSKVTLSEK